MIVTLKQAPTRTLIQFAGVYYRRIDAIAGELYDRAFVRYCNTSHRAYMRRLREAGRA